MGTVIKVAGGIVLAFMVLAGGCVFLVAGSMAKSEMKASNDCSQVSVDVTRAYDNLHGRPHVEGFIVNGSSKTLRYVALSAELLDKGGKTVAVKALATNAADVATGRHAFDIHFNHAEGVRWNDARVWVKECK